MWSKIVDLESDRKNIICTIHQQKNANQKRHKKVRIRKKTVFSFWGSRNKTTKVTICWKKESRKRISKNRIMLQ